MEVEAKFVIPQRDTLVRLQRVVRLGPFTPKAGVSHKVVDRYLDTESCALYRNGYACRFRYRDGARFVTLKGLGGAEAAIHRRFESETTLPEGATADPNTWPDWEGRGLVLSLVGDEPLNELLVVEQVRHVRDLRRDERRVAELSVDEVSIRAGGQHQEFGILEAELIADGTTEDLQALVGHLTETWGLLPEPRSKFELGLALLERDELEAAQGPEHLSPTERDQLGHIVEHAQDKRVQQRARLILGWGEGTPVRELSTQVGLSLSWSYELLKRFREGRMAIFPADLLPSAGAPSAHRSAFSGQLSGGPGPSGLGPSGLGGTEHEARSPGRLEESEERGWGAIQQPVGGAIQQPVGGASLCAQADDGAIVQAPAASGAGMSVDEMCEQFQVDMAHARCVMDRALALFDATASIHKLGPERRRLLEVMGILHNVGLETDPDRHHIAGCDIILENPLRELTEIEQRMLAAAIYLHRKRIKRKRLQAEVVTSLPPTTRHDALVLAALLRMADGLDYAQSQATVLERIRATPAAVQATVSGSFAEVDAARAQAKADLWETLFDVPFFFSTRDLAPVEEEGSIAGGRDLFEVAAPEPPARLKSPGILPDDPMSEAGRKVLHFHFLHMLDHEPGTRAGEHVEELHDMRVATRRMRAAFRVFGPYFKARAIRSYVAGLRRTARALGAVRDLDVFMEKARSYLGTLSSERANDLDPLLQVWQAQREQAREKMIDYLDSDKHRDFVGAFRLFLETPGAGVRGGADRGPEDIPPRPTLASHVAPQLIYTRWAGVQAFGPLLEDAPVSVLHALRIECKRLRYTLEFFEEVLGAEAKEVIAEVVQLQDHLGNLNDADVANALLSDFLFASQPGGPSERVIAPGVVAYLAVKQRELQTLIETFPQTWERFNRSEVRRWLASAVAVL